MTPGPSFAPAPSSGPLRPGLEGRGACDAWRARPSLRGLLSLGACSESAPRVRIDDLAGPQAGWHLHGRPGRVLLVLMMNKIIIRFTLCSESVMAIIESLSSESRFCGSLLCLTGRRPGRGDPTSSSSGAGLSGVTFTVLHRPGHGPGLGSQQVGGHGGSGLSFSLGRRFAAALLPRLFGTNPRPHQNDHYGSDRVPVVLSKVGWSSRSD